jgi:hypothetical protein
MQHFADHLEGRYSVDAVVAPEINRQLGCLVDVLHNADGIDLVAEDPCPFEGDEPRAAVLDCLAEHRFDVRPGVNRYGGQRQVLRQAQRAVGAQVARAIAPTCDRTAVLRHAHLGTGRRIPPGRRGPPERAGLPAGKLISAGLGRGSKGLNYVLHKAGEQGLRDRIPIGNRRGYSFSIPDRDDNGHRALSDLRSRALNGAANADAADEPDRPGQFLVPADHVRHHIADALTRRCGPSTTRVSFLVRAGLPGEIAAALDP